MSETEKLTKHKVENGYGEVDGSEENGQEVWVIIETTRYVYVLSRVHYIWATICLGYWGGSVSLWASLPQNLLRSRTE